MLTGEDLEFDFKRLCNLAWTFAADSHWTPRITANAPNIVACVCLMMAVDLVKPMYAEHKSILKRAFGKLIDKKWNLIFCDDLSDGKYKRLRNLVVKDYQEYDRLMRHHFHTLVIDPQMSERKRKQYPSSSWRL